LYKQTAYCIDFNEYIMLKQLLSSMK